MERIKQLLLQFLREEISSEEMEELEAWLNASPGNRQLLHELNDPAALAQSFARLENMRSNEAWRRVEAFSDMHPPAGKLPGDSILPVSRSVIRKRPVFRWAAAAILLIVAGSISWYFAGKTGERPSVAASPVEKDIPPPGGIRAIITLAGGQKVFLDSAGDGMLAVQGNVKLSKTASGQIVYHHIRQSSQTQLPVYNMLSNPRGSKVVSLILSDGTTVWLNAASSLTYPASFSGEERTVEVSGEAYFEVAHNASLPFRVKAGKMVVEDIGTSFNINAYTDEPSLNAALVKGSVKISLMRDPGDKSSGHKEVILRPGQGARLPGNQSSGTENADITFIPQVDVEQATAWKDGLFSFSQTDLRVVMRQLERWYDLQVVYEGKIEPRRFWGEIKSSSNLSDIFKILEMSNIHFRIEGKNKIVVTP